MKAFICRYGYAHLYPYKCTCYRRNKFATSRLIYVVSKELKDLPPGEYKVTVHPLENGKFELRPLKD